MRWQNLFDELSLLLQEFLVPDVLILHLGGNDIGHVKTLDQIFQIKYDLHQFKLSFPNITLFFFEIIPRLVWLNFPFDKVRKHINRTMAKFLSTIGGFIFRHIDLEGGIIGLFRTDGIHLSDIGLDIFNNNLQTMVELPAFRGGIGPGLSL